MGFFSGLLGGGATEGTGTFGKVGGLILEKLVTGGIIVILVVILCFIIVGIALYIRYNSQFIYDIEIKSLRSSGFGKSQNYKILKDKGAFIRNKKDKSVKFRLKNQRVDLPVPPLECMQLGVKGKNYIKVFQKSDEEYYYLLPSRIDWETVIRDGQEIKIGEETVKVIDGDVAHWNIQQKKENKKIFDTESMVMKLLPYIIPVLMFMLVIFMTYFITNHWGEFTAAAQALEKAANSLASVSTATTTAAGG